VLVSLEAIVPVYVNFNINMRDALVLREELKKLGKESKEVIGTLPVFVALSNEEGFPHQGVLDFVNNSLDTSTGTVQVRAIFPNEDLALIPGFFVTVRVAIGPPFLALTVPNAIIQSDQAGEFVFTVNEKNSVERHDVVLGPPKGTSRAILKGIAEHDRIIISGITRVKVGMLVKPQPASPTALANPTLR
jgi:RND family efflux transporter MFP subunit